MADDDDADIDYEAARAAELQAICDQQLQELLSKRDIFNATFSKLTPSVANKISTEARRIRNYQSPTLSYGEIEFESFGSLVCSLTKHGVDLGAMRTFIDIGSGTGKAVVCAALMGIFEKCTGIEIIAEVHKASTQMLKSFFKNCVSISEAVGIDFILGDATFMDWSKTDMIFIHATCFDEATMNRIISTASKMKNGSVVIVLSQRLDNNSRVCHYFVTTVLFTIVSCHITYYYLQQAQL